MKTSDSTDSTRILVLGNGWLGNKLVYHFNASMSQGDINAINKEHLKSFDVIINTAAKTNIDWCEKNKYEALKSNTLGARRVAELCAELGKKYVFISSACIFESKDSNDWKDETSYPNPGCFYSFTKAIAEMLIQEVNPNALIVRPRLPISSIPSPRNTIDKILSYSKLHANQESVTVVEDFIPALKSLVDEGASGVYHLVNDGTISPIEIRDAMAMGGEYCVFTKEDEKSMVKINGRARRVTTLVKNTKGQKLPDIRERILTLAKDYKEVVNYG